MGGIFSARTSGFISGIKTTDGNTDIDIPDFSEKEKAIIFATWKVIESKSGDVAGDIFLRIFELRPDVKRFFPFSTAVGDALVNHPYFKGHSVRFLNAIGMTVMNLEALEVIHIPNLRKLGQYHTKIPGFTHDIFELFYHAMNYIWAKHLGRAYKAEPKRIWCIIFKFIVDQVELGYHEELAKERAMTTHSEANTNGQVSVVEDITEQSTDGTNSTPASS